MNSDKQILIVDDSKVVIIALTKVLEKHGYTILSANNGEEALKLLEQVRWDIDLILTDIEMPIMNGIAFYKQLQLDYQELVSSTIFMTGHSAKEDIQSFFDENNCVCIRKPIDLKELKSVVDTFINL